MREILLESIIPQSSQLQIPGNVPEVIPEQTEERPADVESDSHTDEHSYGLTELFTRTATAETSITLELKFGPFSLCQCFPSLVSLCKSQGSFGL